MFCTLPCVKVYLDDLLIHSESEETHAMHLENGLKILEKENVPINFEKSQFFTSSVNYLGHSHFFTRQQPTVSCLEGISFTPNTRKKLQRILGLINWHRTYIEDLRIKLSDFYVLLKKDVKFSWNESLTKRLENIVDEIKKKQILYYKDLSKTFELETDAFNIDI